MSTERKNGDPGPGLSRTAELTFCITMGRRPELLDQTLASLGPLLSTMPVLAINDFGDEETNRVFRSACPHGKLMDWKPGSGHHAAVDALYAEVSTQHVFHCEDDWVFTRLDFIEDALALLKGDPLISSVCLRGIDDIPAKDRPSVLHQTSANGQQYVRLDGSHDQWFGYTFNPHIARLDLWRGLWRFSGFRKERHISRKLRAEGRFVA